MALGKTMTYVVRRTKHLAWWAEVDKDDQFIRGFVRSRYRWGKDSYVSVDGPFDADRKWLLSMLVSVRAIGHARRKKARADER